MLERSDTLKTTEERGIDMRKLVYGMNVSLDGYIAAPADDITWSEPSEKLFQGRVH